ncbi:alpha/beta fold hydrolase [Ectobacillus panaciterrae]|uniref:alpha/beta fold hydrolase n=1 Tax=Ectobacillus panaciterrae TaxID=363872 RepID=UPI00042009A2|nr:alpha/beta fold hydrolase [Ectobacillus panaciterrae]
MRPTLIMLSGWGMDAPVWDELCEHLSSHRIRFINWHHTQNAEDIENRVRHIIRQEKKVILIGWSLGAIAALGAAAQEPVYGIVLIGGTARFTQDTNYAGWKAAFVERLKRNIQTQAGRALQRFDESMFSAAEQIWKESFPAVRAQFTAYDTDSLLIGLEYLMQRDVRPLLSSLHVPLLLLHGENDAICSLEAARYIEERTKAHLHIWKEAGHAPHITRAKECARMIQQFAEEGNAHDQ